MEGHIEENALPKNIRQIGYSLTNEKIYIETVPKVLKKSVAIYK